MNNLNLHDIEEIEQSVSKKLYNEYSKKHVYSFNIVFRDSNNKCFEVTIFSNKKLNYNTKSTILGNE